MLNVLVYARSGRLREALTGVIGEFAEVTSASEISPATQTSPSHVVVAPVSDCPPETCGELTGRGWRVVVLAPVPRESERQRYLASGATGYVPMMIHADELRGAVSSAAGAAC